MIFFGSPIIKAVTSSEVVIDRIEDLGISVTIPENSLSVESGESVNFCIRPCFSGPFKLPDDYESASPAYLIHRDNQTPFQEDITVKIHHHISLQSEEDCADMAFLSASATPKSRSHPVYHFRKIPDAEGTFRPHNQLGEISLRRFCFVKGGKRKRNDEPGDSDTKKPRGIQLGYMVRITWYQSFRNPTTVLCEVVSKDGT